jgi:hypothetical protein
LNQENKESPNSPVTTDEIVSVIKSPNLIKVYYVHLWKYHNETILYNKFTETKKDQQRTGWDWMAPLLNFCHTFTEELTSVLLKQFHRIKKEEILLDSGPLT